MHKVGIAGGVVFGPYAEYYSAKLPHMCGLKDIGRACAFPPLRADSVD